MSILCYLASTLSLKRNSFKLLGANVVCFLILPLLQAQENVRTSQNVKVVSQTMPSTVFLKSGEKDEIKALGSGIIVEESGLILTNLHVVEELKYVEAVFFDGSEFKCEILFEDKMTDLALLRLLDTDQKKFKVMPFALPGDIYLAESVIAIGAPFGLDFSVSEGIVSSLNRVLKDQESIIHPRLIQLSVKANQGNSGGPVINMSGEMIGLLLATKTETQGIGFALPVETIYKALRKWLSPEMQLGSELGFEVFTGLNKEQRTAAVVVKNARKGTLNHLLGIKDDMIITKVNDLPIKTSLDFYREILKKPTDSMLKLTLIDGNIQTAKLFELRGLKLAKSKLGLSFEPLGRELAKAVSVPFEDGFVISHIENMSGYLSNLQNGDMLLKIGNKLIRNIDDLEKVLASVEKGDELPIVVLRRSEMEMENVNDVMIVR